MLFTPGDADPNSVSGGKEQRWATLYVGTLQRNCVSTAVACGWSYPYDGIASTKSLAQRLRENGARGRIITDQPKLLAEFRALEALNSGLLVVAAAANGGRRQSSERARGVLAGIVPGREVSGSSRARPA